ncbi:hypothetical protein Scep_009967 [Stephania cephalantha]|uniref:Uncharacterized protein n=1 Tax=Stephania cephalantha TaxID=152367 RepID=A0AAP0JU41_9MAGN
MGQKIDARMDAVEVGAAEGPRTEWIYRGVEIGVSNSDPVTGVSHGRTLPPIDKAMGQAHQICANPPDLAASKLFRLVGDPNLMTIQSFDFRSDVKSEIREVVLRDEKSFPSTPRSTARS